MLLKEVNLLLDFWQVSKAAEFVSRLYLAGQKRGQAPLRVTIADEIKLRSKMIKFKPTEAPVAGFRRGAIHYRVNAQDQANKRDATKLGYNVGVARIRLKANG